MRVFLLICLLWGTLAHKPIYFVHVHKAGGTRLCSLAKSIGYTVSGTKNCGPTVPWKRSRDSAIETTKQMVSNATDSNEVDRSNVVLCVKRSIPDKCNPWLAVNTFGRTRIWTSRSRKYKYELEIPLWLYTDQDEHERVIQESQATFFSNERYLSPVALSELSKTPDNRPYCYVVILRDPLDRVVSHWKHDLRGRINIPRDTGLIGYIQEYHRDNLMTRTLCGSSCAEKTELDQNDYDKAVVNMHHMDVVMLTERYNKGLSRIQRVCGNDHWTSAETHHASSTNARKEMDKNQKKQLKDANRWDIMLYEEAMRIDDEDTMEDKVDVADERKRKRKKKGGGKKKPIAVDRGDQRKSDVDIQFVSDYQSLGPLYRPSVAADQVVRIKFPSLFRTSAGGFRLLFNLRNDYICEGYLVTARVDMNNGVSVVPYSENAEDSFVYPEGERKELFNGKRGISTIPFHFPRARFTFTGPEDPRAATSPDGVMAYLVFNCRNAQGRRQMAVIDYNADPSTGVFLSIREHPTRGTEKNWSPFFVSRNRTNYGNVTEDWILHFVYSIGPTYVLACPGISQALANRVYRIDCELLNPEGFTRLDHFARRVIVRGSSNMVEYRWPYYVGLTHTRLPVLGKCKGAMCKPCYRAQWVLFDMEQMDVVFLSQGLHFPPAFVQGMGRSDAYDSYNHYTTGLYVDQSVSSGPIWYIGMDVDDYHPTLGILRNFPQVIDRVLDGKSLLDPLGDSIHDTARSMDSARTCSQNRMTGMTQWRVAQSKCKGRGKTKLLW
jgi:hypothetical protein